MLIRFVFFLSMVVFSTSVIAGNRSAIHRWNTHEFIQNDSVIFPGFNKMKSFSCDLNKDGFTDWLVIYEKQCSEEEAGTGGEAYCRRLAVFLGVNRFRDSLFGYNDNIIDCSNCGGMGVGDPFRDIVIKKNFFSVEQLYGACEKDFIVITFRYDEQLKDIFLHRKGEEHYKCMFVDEKDIVSHSSGVLDKGSKKIRFCDYIN